MSEKSIYLSYPQGDGIPDCPHCRGRGVRQIPKERMPPGSIIPETEPCPCVRLRDIKANMDRGWKGLSRAKRVDETPLIKHITKDLWVTCTMAGFRGHLARVALVVGKDNPRWFFRVITDVDLMNAWLSKGIEVFDADVDVHRKQQPVSRYADLMDLVEPPTLLIIRLGVKAARNVATPEVLLEALNHRAHIDKPTWIVDQPYQRLHEGHISWDQHVEHFLEEWECAELETEGDGSCSPPAPTSRPRQAQQEGGDLRVTQRPTTLSLGEDMDFDDALPTDPPLGGSGRRDELAQHTQEVKQAEEKKGKWGGRRKKK